MLDFTKLFKLAKDAGIEDIQIGCVTETATSIDFDDLELSQYTINKNTAFSAKGIYKGKMGAYSTEKISESEFSTVVEKIIESAKYITNQDEVFIYEGDKEYTKIKNEFNKDLKEIPVKEKIDLCERISKKLKSKEFVEHTEVEYSESEEDSIMMNSKGLNLKSHTNFFTIFAQAIVSKDNDTRDNYDGYGSNDYSKIDENKIVEDTYDGAIKQLGAKPVNSKEYETIFSEDATATILSCFSGAFSSEAVQKNLSFLKGKVGEKIGSEFCTIVDDPFLEGSPSQTSYDSDGVATRYKEIVKDGVLQGFVYNLKTAKKDGVKSTGNAIGRGCGFINAYFKPGKRRKEEIIGDIKNGLYIDSLMGAHAGAKPMSGDFSLQAKGFVIENGELTKPVALITVSSNFLELLKNITEVSSEIKNLTDSPAIRLKTISVSGL